MDAEEPQFEEPSSPKPTRMSRIRRIARALLRPLGLLRHLFLPLRWMNRPLAPVRRILWPLTDRLVRLPGAILLWTYTHRKFVGLTVGLVLLLSVPYVFRELAIQAIVPPAPPPTVEETLAAVDRQDWPSAKRLAERLGESEDLSEEEAGVPSFVLGLVAVNDAGQFEGPRQKGRLALAARHFSESQAKGFPQGREDEGQYLLGDCLYQSGQMAEAKVALEEGLKADPTRTKEYRSLLAQLYTSTEERDLKKAQQHNGALLAGKLSNSERNDAWLRQCRIAFDLGEMDECRDLLSKIPNEAKLRPEVHGLRGQMLLREARNLESGEPPDRAGAKAKYLEAIAAFRQSQGRGTGDTASNREAMYLIGICLQASGDHRGAVEQFSRTLKQCPDSHEGMAARIELASLLKYLERDDEAIEMYGEIAKSIRDTAKFHNPWRSLDVVRDRLAATQQHYAAKSDFDRAIRLAEVSSPIVPREQALELAAQGYRAWAQSLQAEAQQYSGAKARELERVAREKLRSAGVRFAQLAELRLPTKFYAEDLWQSAQAALAGRDFARAIEMFQRYMQADQRRRRPQSLLAIGEAQIALKQPAAALSTLQECLSAYPTDPACYRARLLCCRALLNQRDGLAVVKEQDAQQLFDKAVALLAENLNGDALSPASLEYRDSLFEKGKMHFERGMELEARGRFLSDRAAESQNASAVTRSDELSKNALQMFVDAHDQYEEAVINLDEALSRYPDAHAAIEARYLLAEAFRHAAAVPREQMKHDTIESTRLAHSRQMLQMLNQAVTYYQQVQETLNRRQERMELTPLEQSILRNSYFLHGASLFDAGRYDDAILAYSTVVNRYQDSPEVLEAYMQIANCYWRLNRLVEFQGTISQAAVVLKGMQNSDHGTDRFASVTNLSRDNWQRHLDWLKAVRSSNKGANPTIQTAARTP